MSRHRARHVLAALVGIAPALIFACSVPGGLPNSGLDAGSPDTGTTDSGLDAGPPDTGTTDSALDAGSPDTGTDSGIGAHDGGSAVPNSCAVAGDGRTNCGGGAESCCASLPVTGGTFSRSYDGVNDGGYTDPQYRATVADFRLDKYEITVGRFRSFVDAVVRGWTPSGGSGKHTHLNGGLGLAQSGSGPEGGWESAWSSNLSPFKATWDSSLACDTYVTWTPSAGGNEKRPINCVTWYEATAFCIWDGGFLPSEAEWNYAAAGGSDQRVYPWSSPPSSTTISSANAVYFDGSGLSTWNVGSKSPAGNGRGYGQTDLSGNVWEWIIDYYKSPYNETSCINCAYLTPDGSGYRVFRGGSFGNATWEAARQLPLHRPADPSHRYRRRPVRKDPVTKF